MVVLFKLIFITSILVLGYTIITQEGMALYSIRKWAERKKEQGVKIIEPVFLCHWCQPSTWSLLGFAFAFGLGIITSLTWRILFLYPLVVGGSSLLNGLIWGYHLKTDAETNFYKSAENAADSFAESIYESYETEEEYLEHTNN